MSDGACRDASRRHRLPRTAARRWRGIQRPLRYAANVTKDVQDAVKEWVAGAGGSKADGATVSHGHHRTRMKAGLGGLQGKSARPGRIALCQLAAPPFAVSE